VTAVWQCDDVPQAGRIVSTLMSAGCGTVPCASSSLVIYCLVTASEKAGLTVAAPKEVSPAFARKSLIVGAGS